MPELFKCNKCGKQLGNLREQEVHEKDCKGISFTMDVIEKLARGEPIEPDIGFDCDICGEFQSIDEVAMIRTRYMSLICDNCKSDLKEIILLKRKKNEGNEKPI